MSKFTKENLRHLAHLAKIELRKDEEEPLAADLAKILDYFSELQKVDTEGVIPVSGGGNSVNVFRKDDPEGRKLPRKSAVEAFPESEDGYLKIPPVFDKKS